MDEQVTKLRYLRLTQSLDKILLNKFLGLPIFFGLMYLAFVFVMQLGGRLQAFFEYFLELIFQRTPLALLASSDLPLWLCDLLLGIGSGFKTTFSFIPVIAAMFFCLSFLETSGYMARAAFVMDRIMPSLGLSGRAFIPMIMGFGCNVPAILAAKSLSNPEERLKVIMMSPFMSCGARLGIYALFVAAFFDTQGQNIIFLLYLVGILFALITAWILGTHRYHNEKVSSKNSSRISSKTSPNDLPPFRWPSLKKLCQTTYQRVSSFIRNAGMIIVPVCALFGVLGAFKMDNQGSSWLMRFGQVITPIFSPMGIQKDNWPATVGLLTGVIAKEVVVGTLNTLYSQKARESETMTAAMTNFSVLGDDQPGNGQPDSQKDSLVLGVLKAHFGHPATAFAYLLFVLLYFPCISVLGTIARELSATWALFAALWTSSIAYCVSVIFYQAATFLAHSLSSTIWIGSMMFILLTGIFGIKVWVKYQSGINIRSGVEQDERFKPLPTQVFLK